MRTLILRSMIYLKGQDYKHGPLFHRWLPNYLEDAIDVDTKDINIKMRLTFKITGTMNGRNIITDYSREDVEKNAVPTHAIVDSGPLITFIEIKDISDDEYEVLYNDKIGDLLYEKLGKRINKFAVPYIFRLINILRTIYGQYWIPELKEWDSTIGESLGSYFANKLNMAWQSSDEIWHPFVPTVPEQPPMTFILGFGEKRIFREYPTKEDWEKIKDLVKDGYVPSEEIIILSGANESLDKGNLELAVIKGCTVLDIIIKKYDKNLEIDNMIKDYFENKLNNDEDLMKYVNKKIQDKIYVIINMSIAMGIPIKDIKDTIEVIGMRHKIIHDGWDIHDNKRNIVTVFLNNVRYLLNSQKCKLPSLNPGNRIMSIEQWKEYDDKYNKM